MKLIKALIILFLILSSHVIESKTKLRRKKNHSRVSSKTRGATIDELFSNIMNKENLFDFIIGALSEWLPSFNKVYEKKKNFMKFAGHCLNGATFTKKTGKKVETFISTDENWLNLKSEDERYEFCTNAKKDIRQNYYGDSWSKYLVSFIRSPEYCYVDELSNEIKEKIVTKYRSMNTYKRECLFFEGLDCDTIKQSIFSTVTSFMSNSMTYLSGLYSVQTCLTNIKDYIAEFEFVKEALQTSIGTYITTAVGVLANYLTGSTWGQAKGSYLIVDLGMKLYDFSLQIAKEIKDAFFTLGKLVAKAINAAKAFIMGRKKRFNGKATNNSK